VEFRPTAALSSTNQPIGKWYLHFPTIAGWVYRIEESQDLQAWTTVPGAEFYGTGETASWFATDGPPPYVPPTNGTPPPAATAWQSRSITLKLEVQAGFSGSNYRISRAAQGDLPPWDAMLTDSLPIIAAGRRLYVLNDWRDETNKILYNINLDVIASNAGPPEEQYNPNPPGAGSTPLQTAELEAYAHVKSRLIYQMGLPASSGGPTPAGPHRYLRLRRVEQDSNQNGLPDWSELSNGVNPFQNNYSALYESDGDGDGLTDAEELAAGTDYSKSDSDQDGATDAYEIRSGSDPWNDQNYPPIFRYLSRKATFYSSFTQGSNPELNPYYMFTEGAGIPKQTPLQSIWQIIKSVEPVFSAISVSNESLPIHPDVLYASPVERSERIPAKESIIDLSVYGNSIIWREGGVQHLTRVWLEQKPAPLSPVNRTYLYRIHRSGSGIPGGIQSTTTPLTFTIPAQSTTSAFRDLSTAFLDGDLYSTGQHYDQRLVTDLIQVVVKQPKVYPDGAFGTLAEPVHEVHLCRWNSEHNISGELVNPQNFPAEDPDRITISIPIPQKSGLGPLKIHVSTDGARDTPGGIDGAGLYNDPGADLEIFETVPGGGVFESKPIVVVADKDDDRWDEGRVAQDGACNDPTLIGWPGGTLKISIPDLNNAVIDFPIKKFSHSFACCTIIAGNLVASDSVSVTSVNENIWQLQKIYAALHERVDFPLENAALISQADLQAIVGNDNKMDDGEAIRLVEKVDKLGLPAGAIKIVFVCKPFYRVDLTGIVGGQNQGHKNGRNDVVMCFLETIAELFGPPYVDSLAIKYSQTAAHECGHSLRGRGHCETGGIFDSAVPNNPAILPRWHLMTEGNNSNKIHKNFPERSGKHWYLSDEEIVHSFPGNNFSKKIQ